MITLPSTTGRDQGLAGPSHRPRGFRGWSLRAASRGSLFGNPMVQQYSA